MTRGCLACGTVIGLDLCNVWGFRSGRYPTATLMVSATLFVGAMGLWLFAWDVCLRAGEGRVFTWPHWIPPVLFVLAHALYTGFRPREETMAARMQQSDRPVLINMVVVVIVLVATGLAAYLVFVPPEPRYVDPNTTAAPAVLQGAAAGAGDGTTKAPWFPQGWLPERPHVQHREGRDASWEPAYVRERSAWVASRTPLMFGTGAFVLSVWFNYVWRVRRDRHHAGAEADEL